MKKITKFTLSALCVAMLSACGDDGKDGVNGADGSNGADGTDGVSTYVTERDVVITNAQHAYAVYADSLIAAKNMQRVIDNFIDSPTASNFIAAKNAWLDAREPYGQSEVYRFREGPIDNLTTDDQGNPVLEAESGPEGAINAWPLAEALIDYTVDMDGAQLPGGSTVTLPVAGNIIADTAEFPVISKTVIAAQFERGDEEANVTSGYHAIEFLLWGQDLNADGSYTPNRDYSAGYRKVSDYYTTASGMGACTSGVDNLVDSSICERRGDYLKAAAQLLVDDLQGVVDAWQPDVGFHYVEFTKEENAKQSLAKILEGMGRLSFGELAGERMSIALRTDSQEDEHSCFSDNTHRDILLNAKGVQNAFNGSYQRLDGELLQGASIYDLLVVEGSFELANELRVAIDDTMAKAAVIDTNAKLGYSFDVQIQTADLKQPITNTIEALKSQTQVIKQAIEALEVTTGDLEQDTDEFGS